MVKLAGFYIPEADFARAAGGSKLLSIRRERDDHDRGIGVALDAPLQEDRDVNFRALCKRLTVDEAIPRLVPMVNRLERFGVPDGDISRSPQLHSAAATGSDPALVRRNRRATKVVSCSF